MYIFGKTFITGKNFENRGFNIQSSFKIINYQKIVNCDLFKNLTLGFDPKIFTSEQIKKFFKKHNNVKIIEQNLVDQISKKKRISGKPFFSLEDKIVGEDYKKKILKMQDLCLKEV